MYKIIMKTKTFNKPGINPTTKNGTDMGYLDSSYPAFEARAEVNGWLSIWPNQWVMKSACKVEVTNPPTDDPPPAEKQRAIIQTFNGVDFETTETWERIS